MSESLTGALCPLAKLGHLSPACSSIELVALRRKNRCDSAASLDELSSSDLYNNDHGRWKDQNASLVNSSINSSGGGGRCSPCLDHGYHTLVSASPAAWTAKTNSVVNNLLNNKYNKKSLACSSYKCNYFEKLSDELTLKIFSFLNINELCASSSVCRRFYHLTCHKSLWKCCNFSGHKLSADKGIKSILQRLSNNTYVDEDPATVIQQIFVYDGAKITNDGLRLLANRCLELTHLHLQNCPAVTDCALSELLMKCPNLQHLNLAGCASISNFNIVLPHPSRKLLLQYLDLTDCTAVHDAALREILRNSPHLIYLYLRRCLSLTDGGVKFIPSFCSSLREVSMSDCSEITDFALYELAKLGTNLRYLSVAKCNRVSDAGLKVIAKRCYKLRYLNVRGCEAVSDDAVIILARSCSRLRALDIGKCDVSDAGLKALAECCPNLKKLSLRNCDLITNKGLQLVSYYCRGLQQLNIQDCQITLDGYKAVKRYCKRCIIEHSNPAFF